MISAGRKKGCQAQLTFQEWSFITDFLKLGNIFAANA